MFNHDVDVSVDVCAPPLLGSQTGSENLQEGLRVLARQGSNYCFALTLDSADGPFNGALRRIDECFLGFCLKPTPAYSDFVRFEKAHQAFEGSIKAQLLAHPTLRPRSAASAELAQTTSTSDAQSERADLLPRKLTKSRVATSAGSTSSGAALGPIDVKAMQSSSLRRASRSTAANASVFSKSKSTCHGERICKCDPFIVFGAR